MRQGSLSLTQPTESRMYILLCNVFMLAGVLSAMHTQLPRGVHMQCSPGSRNEGCWLPQYAGEHGVEAAAASLR